MLGVRYGYYRGINVTDSYDPPGLEDDSATNISEGDEPTGTQTTSGLEVDWTYYGLEFGYGLYSNNRFGETNDGQAFSIAYTLNF